MKIWFYNTFIIYYISDLKIIVKNKILNLPNDPFFSLCVADAQNPHKIKMLKFVKHPFYYYIYHKHKKLLQNKYI